MNAILAIILVAFYLGVLTVIGLLLAIWLLKQVFKYIDNP